MSRACHNHWFSAVAHRANHAYFKSDAYKQHQNALSNLLQHGDRLY